MFFLFSTWHYRKTHEDSRSELRRDWASRIRKQRKNRKERPFCAPKKTSQCVRIPFSFSQFVPFRAISALSFRKSASQGVPIIRAISAFWLRKRTFQGVAIRLFVSFFIFSKLAQMRSWLPYQTCPEMLSLLGTQTAQLKWTSKRETSMVKAVRERMPPKVGATAPPTGHSLRVPYLTAVYYWFIAFWVPF